MGFPRLRADRAFMPHCCYTGDQTRVGRMTDSNSILFAESYGALRLGRLRAAEGEPAVPEHALQSIWYEQLFPADKLALEDGRAVRVLSPGWWNRGEGPDFKNAQIEFAGRLRTGDVEIHMNHGAWTAHGHQDDRRYDRVILHVVWESAPAAAPARNSQGEPIPTLLLGKYVSRDVLEMASSVRGDESYAIPEARPGACAALAVWDDPEALERFLHLAGEWRMLNKARLLRERMEQAGVDQAVYELFLAACGYAPFKQQFRAIARALPYDRARQLAQRDPLLLEAALFQIAGLLPPTLPAQTGPVPHHARMTALQSEHLAGLRSLPLVWPRTGIRPNNRPERRLAGAARFLARTAPDGLTGSLIPVWRSGQDDLATRRSFEALFARPTGFWATHYSWTGREMRAAAPLGAARIRSIIGNVFVVTGLALARAHRDRLLEERVFSFFLALPRETGNAIVNRVLPRLTAPDTLKMTFRLQQGLLQMHEDWCEPNPSCHNCGLLPHLARHLDALPRR